MNYGKKGLRKIQRSYHARGLKLTKSIGVIALELFLAAFVTIIIAGVALAIGAFRGILSSTPDITIADVMPTGFASVVYDNEGHEMVKLVAEGSNRSPVTIDLIPECTQKAFVAIEDERFYDHNGIDIKGIARAILSAASDGGHFSSGASTITQQLLKNNVFDNWTEEKTFIEKVKRKIQEQYLAVQLETVMTKEEILEYYLNTINLGHSTLGIQAASQRYFNKPCYELNLSESAVIASITQNPSYYDPIIYPEHNVNRRQDVLDKMLKLEFITQEEFDEACADNVYDRIEVVNQALSGSSNYTYFEDALVDQLTDDLLEAGYTKTQANYLLYSGGLSIYSTQDSEIQRKIDAVFTNEDNFPDNVKYLLSYALTIEKDGDYVNYSQYSLQSYFKEVKGSKFSLLFDSEDSIYEHIEKYKEHVLEDGGEFISETISITPQPQASITVEDPTTGYVVAMIGGRGPKEGSRTLNRAYSTYRSPGSTFKVVCAYSAALDTGLKTLASVYMDAPFNYTNGTPVVNYDGGYDGNLNIRKAIMKSKNIIAVKTLTEITPELCFSYLQNYGFTTLIGGEFKTVTVNGEPTQKYYTDITQALTLGGLTNGVSNYDLCGAYSAIANGGYYNQPIMYTKVVDSDGNVILDKLSSQEQRQVIKPTTAYLLTSAMQDVVSGGTGTAAKFSGQAIAGKTGTSSKYKDVWFAGFTPYYTATVWVGIDNNVSLSSSGEKNLAKKLWKLSMESIHENLEYKSFSSPGGISKCTVCSASGKLPVAGLCDGCIYTEIFEEGTQPTEYCDLHYAGWLCAVDGLPACEQCPFKIGGVSTLAPIEAEVLMQGNTTVNADGTTNTHRSNVCTHNEEFMSTAGYDQALLAQWLSLSTEYQTAILEQGGSQYFRTLLGYGVSAEQNTGDVTTEN
ncbi:MAG: transglycosylase domain-containing protein [Lachnospiraceae bacterium]|nr:transglycosylase domain-containing protein [Candidatus Merdinaster equi]